MSALSPASSEGAGLYEELLAVHGIMRRGCDLVADAYERLAAGDPVDPTALAATTRWLVAFVHHHHSSEDDLLWPVLRERFPDAVADLDRLTKEHEALDAELDALTAATDAIAAAGGGRGNPGNPVLVVGHAAVAGNPAAQEVRDILGNHLGAEEPVLKELFPQVPDPDVVRLRRAVVAGAPRSGPHLVLGLMADPEPVPGAARMTAHFPAPVRWARPLLLGRYRRNLAALLAS
ncbi:hemerythrin domain-containing protein [Actinacidiphila acididurans]|uniref:Hemerythrin domain-containing protein n=1 Tax=Actinacidiphila acididurans TaxID=2784346 RepID=A0ABS2U4I1_9ACTN|nr:hemerythrin domain-containing protein [Actinacidiphila acididurans]MBM9509902.1 hemerythrin domain-containing protein [Actinacidiphila acididurans]